MPNESTGGIPNPSSFADIFAYAKQEIEGAIEASEIVEAEVISDTMNPLIQTTEVIAGNEGAMQEVFSSAAQYIKKGSQKLMAEGGDVATRAFRNAATTLVKQLGTRKLFISRIVSLAKSQEMKENQEFSSDAIRRITSQGDISSISDDLHKLIEAVEGVIKYEKELEAYYQKELSLFKKMSTIKTTAQAVDLINELDRLKLPEEKFSVSSDSMSSNDLLPGGKVFVAKGEGKLDITSEEVSVKDNTVSFAKDDVLRILSQLNKLVDLYKQLAKALSSYGDYIKEFNTVVGTAFTALEKVKGEMSINLIRDLQGRLQGNTLLYTFYSGFLPKVTIYLDDYVEGLTSSLSKQFN